MLRTCNGTDPNLVDAHGQPCRCGRTFDDVHHLVIYPHQRLLSPAEKAAMVDFLAQLFDLPAVQLQHLDLDLPPPPHPTVTTQVPPEVP